MIMTTMFDYLMMMNLVMHVVPVAAAVGAAIGFGIKAYQQG